MTDKYVTPPPPLAGKQIGDNNAILWLVGETNDCIHEWSLKPSKRYGGWLRCKCKKCRAEMYQTAEHPNRASARCNILGIAPEFTPARNGG